MCHWNNKVGGNLLMKNNNSGWNKQDGWTFSSKQRHRLGGMFSLGPFLSQHFHQGPNSVGLKNELKN